MRINAQNLRMVGTAFNAAFKAGLGTAPDMHLEIATEVPSSTKQEEYGWLGKVPGFREWVGDRVIQNLATHGYTVKNKPFEMTIGVDRDDVEDDTYGVYTPLFQEMGRATKVFPSELVFALLAAGFTTPCYDGQNFFDVDHPVLDKDGNAQSVSNMQAGAGPAWFLMDTTRALKPLLYQKRRSFDFVAKDDLTDENVFSKKEFQYGVDGRSNAGFGFWQFAFGSKADLTPANYEAARAALTSMKGDYGKPIGVMPNLLVVPPSLEGVGLDIVNSATGANGATNKWKGTAKLLVVPWLA